MKFHVKISFWLSSFLFVDPDQSVCNIRTGQTGENVYIIVGQGLTVIDREFLPILSYLPDKGT